MKKQVLMVGFLCVVGQQLYGLTDQEVLRTIVSNHTRALDRRNMYDRQLDNDDLAGWDQAIVQVKEFVEANSKKLKKQLTKFFNGINNANNDLINGIKSAYAVIAGGGLDSNTQKQFNKNFAIIEADMKKIQNGLEWIDSDKESEQQAIKMVSTLAKFVGVTARKAANNLSFMTK